MYAECLATEISAHTSYKRYAHELLRLWLGDPAPMRRWLGLRPDLGLEAWTLLWYEICLHAGRVVGKPIVREDHCAGPRYTTKCLPYRNLILTGGGPRVVDNPVVLADAFQDAIAGPCTLESHRLGMLTLLEQLAADALPPDVDVGDAVCVALHHTDYPTHLMEKSPLGRAPMPSGGTSAAAAWPALAHLPAIMADPRRLHEHLAAGLRAPTASRRALSLRLLALDKATRSRQP